jgi:Flp pilus assembly protein TadD
MTPEEIEEHNRAFEQAAQLAKQEIIVDGCQPSSSLQRSARFNMERSLELFTRVLELNPRNWSAMWLVGKVHQRFGDYATAFTWFVQAYKINPSQPDVAREASICAMFLGCSEDAISYAQGALRSRPSNGLQANLALALLLAGRLGEAKMAIDKATAGDSTDTVAQTVRGMVDHFIAIGRTPPNTTAALEDYWRRLPRSA